MAPDSAGRVRRRRRRRARLYWWGDMAVNWDDILGKPTEFPPSAHASTHEPLGTDEVTGVQGPEGPQGPPGDPGADGADGAPGTPGAPGSVWREGTGVPSNGLGINGDFYLNDANGDVYLKSAGAYAVVANIRGPQGVQGNPGVDGNDGAPGTDGADGVGVPVGGTVGQLLAKNSGTDFDTEWVDPPVGGGSSKSWIRANVNRTLPNNVNLNALFGAPANGRLTLTTGIWRFRGLLIVTAMSATSGNARINVIGAGTATIGTWLWQVAGVDNTNVNIPAAENSAQYQVSATGASAVIAGTGTAMRLKIEGEFECTAAGTLIPSIQLVTAAAAILQAGSFLEFERVGDVDAVSAGSWD